MHAKRSRRTDIETGPARSADATKFGPNMATARSLTASLLNGVLGYAGVEIRAVPKQPIPASDEFKGFEPWVAEIIERVRPFTMTSDERISALCHAARYVVRSNIPGDMVECGVWRGGSTMAAALTLIAEDDRSRTLHLFDTFEGMPPPTGIDREAQSGEPASVLLEGADEGSDLRGYAPLDQVRTNLASTGYPAEQPPTLSREEWKTRSRPMPRAKLHAPARYRLVSIDET